MHKPSPIVTVRSQLHGRSGNETPLAPPSTYKKRTNRTYGNTPRLT